jgi:tetratricopeptide (TPR) repeat protein
MTPRFSVSWGHCALLALFAVSAQASVVLQGTINDTPMIEPHKPYTPKGSQTLSSPQAQAKLDDAHKKLQAGELTAAAAAFDEVARLERKAYAPRLGQADTALRRGKPADAERYMTEALALGPDSAEVAAAAGRLAYGLGQLAEAERLMLRAIQIDPSFLTPHTDLGEMYLSRQRIDDAAKVFRRAIAVAPDRPGVQFGLGRALAAKRDSAGAATAFEAAARLAPGSALPLIGLAEVQARDRQFAPALATLDRALKAEPASMPARMARADVLAASGERAQAVAVYEEMLKTEAPPRSALLHLKLGILQQSGNQSDAALASYQKAAQADPKLHMAHNNFAWLAAQGKRDLDRALQSAERAVALAPGAHNYLDTLGFVRAARGEQDQALDAYRRSLRAAPNMPGVQYRLGLVLEAKGDAAAAAAQYKAALTSPKGFEERQSAQQRLDALGAKR